MAIITSSNTIGCRSPTNLISSSSTKYRMKMTSLNFFPVPTCMIIRWLQWAVLCKTMCLISITVPGPCNSMASLKEAYQARRTQNTHHSTICWQAIINLVLSIVKAKLLPLLFMKFKTPKMRPLARIQSSLVPRHTSSASTIITSVHRATSPTDADATSSTIIPLLPAANTITTSRRHHHHHTISNNRVTSTNLAKPTESTSNATHVHTAVHFLAVKRSLAAATIGNAMRPLSTIFTSPSNALSLVHPPRKVKLVRVDYSELLQSWPGICKARSMNL